MNQYAVQWAITPLRLIFWGGLLCVCDVTFSQTTNGRGFKFDILNDALGALLIAVGVFRLAAIPVSRRYATAMKFVQVVAALAVADAIRSHFITPLPPGFPLVLQTFGLITLAAIIVFCVAMRWFCDEAHLAEAARSWTVTTVLFVLIYLAPLGLLHVITAAAIASGTSFNINLGPAGLLLLPVFAIPLIHLFISTSRMKRGAEAVVTADSDDVQAGAQPQPPPRPAVPVRTLLVAVSLAALTLAGTVLAVVFLPGRQQGASKSQSEVRVGPSGSRGIEDALATEDTEPLSSGYFGQAQYGVANGEYAFLVIPALRRQEVTGEGSGSSSSGEFRGHWATKDGSALGFRCKVSTGEVASGVMEIGNSQWSLADGRVFLVKPRAGAVADVRQVEAPLAGDTPEEALKNLVTKSDAVRGFLVAELTEGLRSDDPGRRGDAALFLYRCGLAGELKTPLLIDLLKDDNGWVRLMAAKALWDRQRHEAAVPTLVALLQEAGPDGWVRRQSARVLGEIGPGAKAAIPALREARHSKDRELGAAAAEALKRIEK